MSFYAWWKRRGGGRLPAGYGTPLVLTTRPLIGVRYGVHLGHAPKGGGVMLKTEVSWRSVSGLVINTSRGAVFLYIRRWAA